MFQRVVRSQIRLSEDACDDSARRQPPGSRDPVVQFSRRDHQSEGAPVLGDRATHHLAAKLVQVADQTRGNNIERHRHGAGPPRSTGDLRDEPRQENRRDFAADPALQNTITGARADNKRCAP